jgi:hypothetical protein
MQEFFECLNEPRYESSCIIQQQDFSERLAGVYKKSEYMREKSTSVEEPQNLFEEIQRYRLIRIIESQF